MSALALAGGGFARAGLADPQPTIEEVTNRVDRLHRTAEHIAQRSNEYGDEAGSARRRLERLEADIERQQQQVGRLHHQVGTQAVAEYRTMQLDTTVQLLVSDSPEEFLAMLGTTQALREKKVGTLRRLQREQQDLSRQQEQLRAELARYRSARARMLERREDARAKAAEAEELLQSLTAQQRARYDRRASQVSRDHVRPVPPLPAGSNRGLIALRFAVEQIGEPYVFGAAGPDSWDCSGLTMSAWKQAGVQLPHSSHRQYEQSVQLSARQLRPGDLVFFYDDLSHVGIYAGNGQMVHSPRPGKGVEWSPISTMPITGFARPA